MIFSVEQDGEQRLVEVRRDGRTCTVTDGDRGFDFDARALAPGWWSILIGSRSFTATVERDGTTYTVEIRGRRFVFQLADPSRAALRKSSSRRHGPGRVVAPMPGRVIRLLVEKGQRVQQGDGVAVVEAMKMENEIPAPRDGVVVEVAIEAGEIVEGGALLVAIDAPVDT